MSVPENGETERHDAVATATIEAAPLPGANGDEQSAEQAAIEEAASHLGEGQAPVAAKLDEPSGFRRTLREARDFKAVAASPYGLTPALVFGATFFLQNFDTAAFSLASPDIARDLEINVGDIISIQVIVGSVAVFAAIVAGYFADRMRRVPFFGLGVLFSGIFSMVGARAYSFASIATPRVLDDVSDQAAQVPAFSLLADYYPHHVRGKVFALLGTMSRVARAIVPITIGVIVVGLSWRWAFALAGAALVVMGVVILVTLARKEPIRGYHERKVLGASEEEAQQEDEPQSFGEAWRATWGVRTVRRVVIAQIFAGAAEAVSSLFFIFFLSEIYGLDALERGLVFTPVVLAAIVGGFIGGGLVDRFTADNPARVLVVLGLFSLALAPAPLVWVFQPPIWVIVLVGAFSGFGSAMIGPATGVVYAQVIPPNIRTQGLQMAGLASLPTLILFLPIARTIFGLYGYEEVFLYTIPLAVLGAIIFTTSAGFFELDMRAAFAAAVADQEWRKAKAAGQAKLLVCRDVQVEYDGVQVLFGVDFDVEEGEIIALLGTNGAGKSTLLRAISGTAQATGGAIVFDGRDITYMPPHEIVGRGVVHMPGGRGVFPELSVRENLMLANWLVDDPAEIRQRLDETLDIFPALRNRLDVNAGLLSGGEQQQLSLAQAFLSKPRLLLIDELSLGLSPTAVANLLEIVREIHRRGVTIVVVEQSVNVALTIADKAVFMEKGEVRFQGPTAELLERGDILRAVYVKGSGALTAGGPSGARRSERQQRALELKEARPVLEVAGITKRYGGITAVDDVSFQLRDGEVLGLIGPNGAGKTTIFELISGYQIPDSGTVVYDGVDVTDWSPDQRAREGLVRRFQDARLFPALTVHECIMMALEQHTEVRSTLLHALSVPRARRSERRVRARSDRLIELFELGAYRDKFVKELSTGLRRVVDLACVLATEPRVLLLDEPSSGIAQAETESLGPLLRRVRFETGCSILIIEHDMPLISKVSDQLLALDLGAVVVQGTPDEVLNDQRVIESYLGTDEAAVKRSGSQ